MIIVITHDATMRDFYGNYISRRQQNYQYWRRAFVLNADLNRAQATGQIQQLLGQLQPDEPLCLVGHGNDQGIGDHPGGAPGTWWWTGTRHDHYISLAELFGVYLPDGYEQQGVILLEACGQSVANLPPRIANALEGSRLVGLWIHGHQQAVGITDALPNATQLDGQYYPGAQVT